MLYWQDQTRVCETLVPTDSHFYEHQKRTMLENAVASVDPLRAIKINLISSFHTVGEN